MTSRYLRKSQSKNRLKCSRRARVYRLVIIMSNGGLPKTSLGQPSELRWFWHWDRRRASPTSACAAKLIGLYLSIQKTSQIYQAKLRTARSSTLLELQFVARTADPARKLAPWVLNASFIAPHFPLITPQEYWETYPHEEVDMPATAFGPHLKISLLFCAESAGFNKTRLG